MPKKRQKPSQKRKPPRGPQQPKPPRRPRDLRESPEFAREKLLIHKDVRRLDEILRGLTYRLALEPEGGELVDGTHGLWGITSEHYSPESISVAIFYTFDAAIVTLESIVLASPVN